ncbi:MAG: hypothetical protein JWN56_1500 [Sphingobacteriales bacterium]|nr:hypothetical protein [Sphingobacteriales bacterium]
MKPESIVYRIGALEVSVIYNVTERAASIIVNKMREMFSIKKHQLVTIYNLSDYSGCPVSELTKTILDYRRGNLGSW